MTRLSIVIPGQLVGAGQREKPVLAAPHLPAGVLHLSLEAGILVSVSCPVTNCAMLAVMMDTVCWLWLYWRTLQEATLLLGR